MSPAVDQLGETEVELLTTADIFVKRLMLIFSTDTI